MELAYSEALDGVVESLKLGSGILPLNRLETGNWDFFASLIALTDRGALESLRQRFRELTGRRHVFFAASCRAALAEVLTLLPQQEVVIPVYTCAVVKLAAQVSGKKIIYVDLAPGSVNCTSLEFEKYARPGRILIPTHVFGVPTDIEQICELARERGCVTIEDAAGAVGARYGQSVLGTFGDFGVYSFERSKRFPAFNGAVLVVNNERILEPERLGKANALGARDKSVFDDIVSCLFYNLASLPWVYGKLVVPHRLRGYAAWKPAKAAYALEEAVETKFFKRRFQPYQAKLVLRMLSRLERIRERIGRLVSVYLTELRDTPVRTFLQSSDNRDLLRFPVAIPAMRRAEVLRRALQRGLFLETNYEQILADGASPDEFPHGRWAAENVVLLPLYASLPDQSARRIAREVVAIAGDTDCGAIPVPEVARLNGRPVGSPER